MAFEREQLQPGFNIPDANGSIFSGRGQSLSVRREFDRAHGAAVPSEGTNLAARESVQEPHEMIGAAGRDELTVRRKLRLRVRLEFQQLRPSLHVPNSAKFIKPFRDQPGAVAREANSPDGV